MACAALRPWVLCAALCLASGVRADPTLVNIAGPAYGTTVRADTQYSPQYAPDSVVDGVVAKGPGCWFSGDNTPLPCALTFAFAERERVEELVLYQASWNGSMYHSRNVAVEVSGDGATWKRVGEVELPDASEARVEVPLGGVEASHLRLVVLTSYVAYQTCGFAEVEILAGGRPVAGAIAFEDSAGPLPASLASSDMQVLGRERGPQVALMSEPAAFVVALAKGEGVAARIPVSGVDAPITLHATAECLGPEPAEARLSVGEAATRRALGPGTPVSVDLSAPRGAGEVMASLGTTCARGDTAVRWSDVRVVVGDRSPHITFAATPPWKDSDPGPPPRMPSLRPAIEDALIEWDWRMRDGIGAPRNPSTYRAAIERMCARGTALLARGTPEPAELRNWQALASRASAEGDSQALWLALHRVLRALVLSRAPGLDKPILFAKQVPGTFSHQLTQYYGRYARPGGGLFVLGQPGRSMRCRELLGGLLPGGSVMQPELSYDGRSVLFAYCEAPTTPEDRIQGQHGRYYHLYRIGIDGKGLAQLTDGPFNDFSPRHLPDGRMVFISTRRLGWHRCGNPGCENYTLAMANADGSDPHPVSYHETQEWDPTVLDDGRVVYTRWDYVDRHAIFYEQLWTVHSDGSTPTILYGNNTFDPVGIWEARQVPGSRRIVATAAAHHAMTAGSLILLDPAIGVDGPEPIERLTPEVPFPESETLLRPSWRAPLPEVALVTTPEDDRWPGHCYRSPYPLSEDMFLAAYSYAPLVGEPMANAANMFGLYLVDRSGDRELLCRDLNIASLWPVPVRPRPMPPVTRGAPDVAPHEGEGLVIVQDARESTPSVPEPIRAIRIVQVVPKSTPGANNPTVGLAFASPGKQVLGTVPVEDDGSACFRVPAGIPLSFQALDQRGMALQTMRSVTYVQPGQTLTCAGCHEPRTTAPPNRRAKAGLREPSPIRPAPDGAKPLSYPLLVQPVLDRLCVSCHAGPEAKGGVRLTGEAEGRYTASYNALAPRVPYPEWKGSGDFREANSEPLAKPLFFGARGSNVMRMLLDGHRGVTLSPEDIERLATWMDANALFYGTFDPADQARQQRGERIDSAKLH